MVVGRGFAKLLFWTWEDDLSNKEMLVKSIFTKVAWKQMRYATEVNMIFRSNEPKEKEHGRAMQWVGGVLKWFKNIYGKCGEK